MTELPLLPRIEMPTVGIVTLLFTEKLAVDAMMENKKTYVWRRPGDRGTSLGLAYCSLLFIYLSSIAEVACDVYQH